MGAVGGADAFSGGDVGGELEGFEVAAGFEVEAEDEVAVGGDDGGGVGLEVGEVAGVSGDAGGVVEAHRGVELEGAVGLEVEGLCVVGGEEDELEVEGGGVAGVFQRGGGEVVDALLGLVCACAHRQS